ncbi:chromosomal replication initiator protein DnaA [Pacificimonas sp. WHA3]|uniref:Chromosomal replication initiator protein DnaA n=1 Tax=Pacificimonas pallii TaxID=2827236 RepID=A0ABS6SG00_9SPHN|nr:chromosomal replication initiator protein DnaA [Pacificimonas pallii]MBV7257334.1 chromosomal replication initiator protein DnaA [Pacificimonas pallii]
MSGAHNRKLRDVWDGAQQWADVREALQHEVSARTWSSWFSNMVLAGIEDDCAILSVPTAFGADWIRGQYSERLRMLWAKGDSPITHVRIVAGAPIIESDTPIAEIDVSAPPAVPLVDEVLNPRYTFDRFVTGKANELAYCAAETMASGGEISFNPLFLHGATGVGKTHLMHAIGWAYRARRPDAKIIYMSAEKFMFEFVTAMRAKDTLSFKSRLRGADLMMIDDVQFVGGKDTTQEELFHTMNEVINAGHRLVISADRSPQDLDGIEARVRSRLCWGLVADINPAEYELRLNIVREKLAARPAAEQALVPDDVVEFVARKVSANIRELEGAVNRIVAFANTRRRPLDIDQARALLADMLRANTRRVTVDRIQRQTADFFNIKLSDMMSARRARDIARPRQIAMYLAKRMTPRSFPDIGRRFGGRDHTTVMHAVKRIEALRADDGELSADIDRLERLIDL